MRTLWWCLSASFFEAVCRLASLSLMAFPPVIVHVKTIAVFIIRVQYLAETLLRKYVVENANNNSFIFPQTSGKRSLHLIQRS